MWSLFVIFNVLQELPPIYDDYPITIFRLSDWCTIFQILIWLGVLRLSGALVQQQGFTPFLTFSLPGVKKPLGQYGPAGVEDTTAAAPAAADEDDDDIDLFGSDEEEVSSVAEGMVCFETIAWSNDDFSHHLSADVVMDNFFFLKTS